MDSIVEKLAEIEKTAEAIVEHAEAQKYEVEREIQAKRDAFDRELEMNTREEVERIRAEAKEQMDQALEEQRLKNRSAIEDLKKEYEERHTWYARQILKLKKCFILSPSTASVLFRPEEYEDFDVVWLAIPIAAYGKSPFFDRKPKK